MPLALMVAAIMPQTLLVFFEATGLAMVRVGLEVRLLTSASFRFVSDSLYLSGAGSRRAAFRCPRGGRSGPRT